MEAEKVRGDDLLYGTPLVEPGVTHSHVSFKNPMTTTTESESYELLFERRNNKVVCQKLVKSQFTTLVLVLFFQSENAIDLFALERKKS